MMDDQPKPLGLGAGSKRGMDFADPSDSAKRPHTLADTSQSSDSQRATSIFGASTTDQPSPRVDFANSLFGGPSSNVFGQPPSQETPALSAPSSPASIFGQNAAQPKPFVFGQVSSDNVFAANFQPSKFLFGQDAGKPSNASQPQSKDSLASFVGETPSKNLGEPLESSQGFTPLNVSS
jgi:hypothetical protein